MIIHKLIWHHLKAGDNEEFYLLQARDALSWLENHGVAFNADTKCLDLGCGHGIVGAEIAKKGSQITFADQENYLISELKHHSFLKADIDSDDLAALGQYDLVICSNVYEHLTNPNRLLQTMPSMLRNGGYFYLTWTNWLSPWGGHEFSPFHYLGPRFGIRCYDKIIGKSRKHTPGVNLFPTYIGETVKAIHQVPGLKVLKIVPRYYPELGMLMHIPLLREIFAWNCALLIQKTIPNR